jgi:hypothetical protein
MHSVRLDCPSFFCTTLQEMVNIISEYLCGEPHRRTDRVVEHTLLGMSCSIRLDRIQPSYVPLLWIMTHIISACLCGEPHRRSERAVGQHQRSVDAQRPFGPCSILPLHHLTGSHGQHHLSLPLWRTTSAP